MSTHIVDEQVAIRFSGDSLRSHYDHWAFHADYYFLLQLGGDNNTVQSHPRTGSDVRSRKWRLIAAGVEYQVMQAVVHAAADCEGQTVRFANDSSTMAESYIRRGRKAIAEALTFEAAANCGFALDTVIKCPASNADLSDFDRISAIVAPTFDGSVYTWNFQPLVHERDAALFFAFHYLDGRDVWNKAKISGREFDWQRPFSLVA